MREGRRRAALLALFFAVGLWWSPGQAFVVSTGSGGTELRWESPAVSYLFNPSGSPTGSEAALAAAMQAWNAVESSVFVFSYGGITGSRNHGGLDGINLVTFASMGPGAAGTLAVNNYWYDVRTGFIIDSDIRFNTDYPWSTNGSPLSYDVQNIATHEMGHSLSLADLYAPFDAGKTMYGFTALGETTKRTLDADDVNGISYLYPAAVSAFGDVPLIHPYYRFIVSLHDAGITAGCSDSPPLYCPDALITRAQMAVLILTSLGVTPPACTGTRFADVIPLTVGQAFCNYIEELAARGITAGCGGGFYCPDKPVSRAEMAVFIGRALGAAAEPPCVGNRFSDVNTTEMSPAFCGFIEDLARNGITGGCQAGPPPMFCPAALVTRGEMAVFLVAAPPPLLP